MDFENLRESIALEEIEDMLARPDYSAPSKRRKLVDEIFSNVGRGFENIGREYIWVHPDERKKAVLGLMERINEEYSLPDIRSAEQSLAEFEACTFTNYYLLDEEENILLAAALWVLDDLRRNGKLSEAYRCLPDSLLEIGDVYVPVDFYHPCYENELIQSVAHVLNFRDAQDSEAFRELISLLDQEKMAAALEHFKSLQHDVTGRYLRAEEYFDRQKDQLLRKLRSLSVSAPLLMNREEQDDEKLDLAQQIDELESEQSTFRARFEDYLLTGERRIQGIRELGRIMGGFTVGDPYEICFALACLIRQDDQAVWLTRSGAAVVKAAAGLLPWHGFEEAWDEEDWETVGLTYNGNGWLNREPEPEKTGFYHRKQDDLNLAQRIYRLSRGIVPAGLHPFSAERAQMQADGVENADTAADWAEMLFLSAFRAEAVNLRHRYYDWAEEEEQASEEDPRGLFYEGEDGQQAFSSDDEKRAARASAIAAEVLKRLTESIDIHSEKHSETDSEAHEKMVSAGGYWGKIASAQGRKMAEDTAADDEKYAAAKAAGGVAADRADVTEGENARQTAEKLASAKREIKNLKKLLSDMQHDTDVQQIRYERELRTLRREHRELADLRELVFRSATAATDETSGGTASKDKQNKQNRQIEFPYKTQKRTVVFGGHENFLKAIRPMLPDVRFVNVDNYAFNPEIVRNADVVWLQTNHISHTQYGNILRITRPYDIQLRYFDQGGAEKCAQQLAAEDMKE